MKKLFQQFMSFAMAIVVLLSTMSFTVDMHYCGNTLVDTSIFKEAKTCGMKMDKPSTEGCSITKKNCCSDKLIVIDGQDELQLKVEKISIDQQVFIASFVYTYVNLFEGLENKITSFEEYKPPLVIRRIYKIDETYLI